MASVVAVIGGVDKIVNITRPMGWREKMDLFKTLIAVWPNGVLEDTVSANVTRLVEVGSLPDEFFVYRDRKAYESWDEHGATQDNQGAMIHFLLDDEQVTWVIGEEVGEDVTMISETVRLRLLSAGGSDGG